MTFRHNHPGCVYHGRLCRQAAPTEPSSMWDAASMFVIFDGETLGRWVAKDQNDVVRG